MLLKGGMQPLQPLLWICPCCEEWFIGFWPGVLPLHYVSSLLSRFKDFLQIEGTWEFFLQSLEHFLMALILWNQSWSCRISVANPNTDNKRNERVHEAKTCNRFLARKNACVSQFTIGYFFVSYR